MAPEQASGEKAPTTAVDVYSLGAMLYELLAGRTPFAGASPAETLLAVLSRDPERPSSIASAVDSDLETIALKCLDKEPERRYDSAAALADDLDRWLRSEPILARPAGAWESAAKWVRRQPALAALAGVSVVALLACVAFGVGLWFNGQLQAALDDAQRQRDRAQASDEAAREYWYASDIHLAHQSWNEARLGRMHEILDRQVPFAGQPDLRGFEWHYLRQLGRSERRSFPAGKHVGTLLLSPDSSRVTTVDSLAEHVTWDVATGRRLAAAPGPGTGIQRIANLPDGRMLVSHDEDSLLRIWSSSPRGETTLGKTEGALIVGAALARDGSRLAIRTTEHRVRVFDLQAKKELPAIPPPEGRAVMSLALSPDGETLALYTSEIALYRTATGEKLGSMDELGHYPCVMAFSGDGKRLATGTAWGWTMAGEQTVGIWDVAERKKLALLEGHQGRIEALAFSQDDKLLASGSADTSIKLWDMEHFVQRASWPAHSGAVRAISFAPQSAEETVRRGELLLASAGDDGLVKIWDALHPPGKIEIPSSLPAGTHPVLTRDGSLAIQDNVDTVRWISTETGQETRLFAPGRRIVCFALSPDETQIAFAAELTKGQRLATIHIWSLDPPRELKQLATQIAEVHWLAWSPAGQTLLVRGDVPDEHQERTTELWDLAGGKLRATLKAGSDLDLRSPGSLAFSPRGEVLAAVTGDSEFTLFDGTSGAMVRKLEGFKSSRALAFAPDDATIALSDECDLELWNWRTGEKQSRLPRPNGDLFSRPVQLTFSPDGMRLAFVREGSKAAVLWDITAQRFTLMVKGRLETPGPLRFSPDGKTLAVGDIWPITCYQVTTGQELLTVTGPHLPVAWIGFTSNSRTLISLHSTDRDRYGHHLLLWPGK